MSEEAVKRLVMVMRVYIALVAMCTVGLWLLGVSWQEALGGSILGIGFVGGAFFLAGGGNEWVMSGKTWGR